MKKIKELEKIYKKEEFRMMNFIDVSKINCWIGQLLPGGSKNKDKNAVENFQNECKENGFFRIGWNIKNSNFYDKFIDDDIKKSFCEEYKGDKGGLEKALENISGMKKGDLIITRVTGKYYIGMVKFEKAKYVEQKIAENEYRWSVKVAEWIEIPEIHIPGDIVGRFSQRRHPTIQRVGEASMRLKLLLIKIFQNHVKNNDKYKEIEKFKEIKKMNIPRIVLNENNFTSALNYMDLEDLVYLYILSKNEEYQLLPSSCKISKVNYEMDLRNLENKIITCQVKNRECVKYEEFIADANEKIFEKIYLFSGNEKYDNTEIEKDLAEKNKEDIIKENGITIIRKENLFKFFKDEDKVNEKVEILKKKINLDKYYEFKEDEKNLKIPKGWDKWKGKDKDKDEYRGYIPYNKNNKVYMQNIYGDIIFPNNVIYYSSEFQSLIQYGECNNKQFIEDIRSAYAIE